MCFQSPLKITSAIYSQIYQPIEMMYLAEDLQMQIIRKTINYLDQIVLPITVKVYKAAA